MSIGRTDFERGSYADMIASLHMLATKLPSDTKIYAGHGPETTMADEIRYNPYMR
jgi:glyoxylase-like metal-dependent hydrolase (beta-lactamase superfamily II)